MFLFLSTLIFIFTVVYQCEAEHKLVCPYSQSEKNLERVWCKRDPLDFKCCKGFSFRENEVLDNHHLSVSDNGSAFVISMKSLSQGDGVYWCGVMTSTISSGNRQITKLAEKELHNSPTGSIHFVWAILRYLLFGLLLLAVISTHVICSKRKAKE